MLLPLLLAAVAQAKSSPLDFARAEVDQAAGLRRYDVEISVRRGKSPESYTIEPRDGKIRIVGSDPTGAMYGAFEFAERLRNQGSKAWTETANAEPYLPERGVNLFLTLPWDYAKNDTDDDPGALVDPKRWWFQDEHYWTTLLDLMAHSRLNWLDIHGTWDISVTDAPNLYAYFVTSPTFPKVGVSDDIKAADLRQLNHVIDMAHARGIKVSLMSYEAKFHTPQNPKPPYASTEANLYTYTREVVERMIRGLPKLDAIGFRIGESGHGEAFFKCYEEAVKHSGRDIPLITRSWVTHKRNVLPLARASKDFTVEIKYNGEQWAAPYIVEGGRMANWGSYSYEDYLSDSGPGRASKSWPGWPAEGGGSWPPEPYKIVWQVRANGTHRIFPFYNPDWVRRSIECMKMGTVSGYTVEGEDAYFPKDPLYYLANPADKYCDFIHQRDELYWMCWGRLGYDPSTPDSTFDAVVDRWFGASQGPAISKAWKAASEIVPLSYMAYALGPDHRDHAPELETGGEISTRMSGQPFDPLVVQPIDQFWLGGHRPDAGDWADVIGERLTEVGGALSKLDLNQSPAAKRLKELEASWRQLTNYANFEVSELEAESLVAGVPNVWSDRTAEGMLMGDLIRADRSWLRMSSSQEALYYRPFTDRLRMHTNSFHWQVDAKAAIPTSPTHYVSGGALSRDPGWRGPWPGVSLTWSREGGSITCKLIGPQATAASLLWKPLPSTAFFHMMPMRHEGSAFFAKVPSMTCGLCIAAQAERQQTGLDDREVAEVPSFLDGQTPYLVVPSQPGPTPPIYSTEEALNYLDPNILDPAKFGTIVVAPRAARFFGFTHAQQRKLLEGVKRGMKLLILQQDFLAKRYSLGFLPAGLAAEANPTPDIYDDGRQLGHSVLHVEGIQWQRFRATGAWETFGSGGLARLKLGKGEVWVSSARLMQNADNPNVASELKVIVKAFSSTKPAILVDAGTESAFYTTSFWPDLMNSLGVPFLTLGEAIAQEQGVNSATVIDGPTADDDVLGGKGTALANAFLRNQVVAASKQPTPASRSAFEAVRKTRKRELMRMLGLDPMPPKTPLNARTTGTIAGNGFQIEKVVIESRPHFYVTMHVYTPAAAHERRMPVIVNVNGHWAHKKDEDRIQLRCQFQALQGYIAVALDSPGHSFEGDSLIERRAEGDHNDFKLVEGGTNATGYYVWDAIRALDYMGTRPDTDMSRVGITGASGGGLATLYTFAADDRYKAAVPVVYMASMELAPDNGCLCNHVPGTCQIGDRSDVISIQAPKPVLLMGAQNDGEFPPDATRLTQKKMAETWALFGRAEDTYVKIFPGGHDYNEGMRESMIGFFNRYVRGVGDGAPVAQPALTAFNPEDHSILVLDPPIPGERTMRDLSKQYLDEAPANVSAAKAIRINGGRPNMSPLKWHVEGTVRKRVVTFEPMPGLITPAILYLPAGKSKGVVIEAADTGKARPENFNPADDGYAHLCVDILGTGELGGIELRYPTYLGRSVAFFGGWQLVRAAEGVRGMGPIEVRGDGPLASQAVMWAGLLSPTTFSKVVGSDCLPNWQAAMADSVPDAAVQPRAHLCGSLSHLRSQVKNGEWRLAEGRE